MYKEVALTSLKEEAAYKFHVLTTILGSIIQISILYFLWNTIFNSLGAETLQGFTFPMMVTYVSISAILSFYNRSIVEYLMEDDVKTGFISVLLTKPVNYPVYYFFREGGRVIFFMLSSGVPIALVSFFLLNIFGPASLLFFASAFLGFIINFFMVFLTGLWSFWSSGSIWGLRYSRTVISEILSGSLIPIALFPEWLRLVSYALPFQAIYSTPLLIYVGRISGLEIISFIVLQLAWVGILGFAAFKLWKRAEKRTISQGG